MSVYDYYELYITAEDLKGKEWKLTIADVYSKKFPKPGGAMETLLVVKFAECKKRLVLNNAQAGDMERIHGEDEKTWKEKTVVLAPVKNYMNKRTVKVQANLSANAEKLFNAPVSRNAPAVARNVPVTVSA